MTSDNPLTRHVVPPGSGAGFEAKTEGGFALLRPLTTRAGHWLRANVNDEAMWTGDTLVIERRYFPALADAIIAAGFAFERDAYLN